MATPTVALGIDIGGSGIKGAPVDVSTGELLQPRQKLLTPAASTPQAVAAIVGRIAETFADDLPADARSASPSPAWSSTGVVRTAANIDKSWVGAPGEDIFPGPRAPLPARQRRRRSRRGRAALWRGAGRPGLGHPSPRSGPASGSHSSTTCTHPELRAGHLEVDGPRRRDAGGVERQGARGAGGTRGGPPNGSSRSPTLENLLWPDLVVVGGGVSRKADRFLRCSGCGRPSSPRPWRTPPASWAQPPYRRTEAVAAMVDPRRGVGAEPMSG